MTTSTIPKSIINTATIFTVRSRFRMKGSIDFDVPFINFNTTVPHIDHVNPALLMNPPCSDPNGISSRAWTHRLKSIASALRSAVASQHCEARGQVSSR